MSDSNVLMFPTGVPPKLVELGNRADLDTEKLRILAEAVRLERLRIFVQVEALFKLTMAVEKAIAKADALIRPLQAGLED